VKANVHDVACYILKKQGTITAMKLQKLVYYCQAWSLVWDERPMFREKIMAWANGPVVPALYKLHRGVFKVGVWPHGNCQKLDRDATDTIDGVLKFYGGKTAQWLSDLTHEEAPWRDARAGLAPGESGKSEITHAAMEEYYGSLRP
jgi:uncharacterized phage-associated protein